MKTTYEKLARYGVDTWMFGKSKKKRYILFWIIIAAIIMMGLII